MDAWLVSLNIVSQALAMAGCSTCKAVIEHQRCQECGRSISFHLHAEASKHGARFTMWMVVHVTNVVGRYVEIQDAGFHTCSARRGLGSGLARAISPACICLAVAELAPSRHTGMTRSLLSHWRNLRTLTVKPADLPEAEADLSRF